MHRKVFRFFGFVCVLLASITIIVQAQQETSVVISFSGTIPGQPDGNVDLRFRLYTASSGGIIVFEETQPVSVMGERFSVYIGDRTKGGIPPENFASNPSLWIAFAFDATPDSQIGTRSPITAAGYAFLAKNASQLGGIPPSGFIQTTGGSINGSDPAAALSVTNTNTEGGAGIVTESRSAQGVGGLFINSSGGDLIQGKPNAGDPPVFRLFNNGGALFSGNVGIGTATPLYKLDVAGQIRKGCPAGWTDQGHYCYSPVQPADNGYRADLICSREYGAHTCSIGEYYDIGSSSCSGNQCWTNSYCGSGNGVMYVTVGQGWNCAPENDPRQYRCCLSKH